MKLLNLAAVSLSTMFVLTSVAYAQAFLVWEKGSWSVNHLVDGNRQMCMASVGDQFNGPAFSFATDGRDVQMQIFDASFTFDRPQRVSFKAKIDNGYALEFRNARASQNSVFFRIAGKGQPVVDFTNAVSAGRTLKIINVKNGYELYQFDLSGSKRAIEELSECMASL